MKEYTNKSLFYRVVFVVVVAIGTTLFFFVSSWKKVVDFKKNSVIVEAIIKSKQPIKGSAYEYLLEYSYSGKRSQETIVFQQEMGLGDSIELLYNPVNRKFALPAEANDKDWSMLWIGIGLIFLLSLILKYPSLVTRFKGTLDNY